MKLYRIMPILSFCLLGLFTSPAMAWYSQDPEYIRCNKYAYIKVPVLEKISDIDSPASAIEMLHMTELAYTTDDVKENGKVVETTITIPSYRTSVTFYRTKQRCENAIAPLKEKAKEDQMRQKQEMNKYR